MAHDQPINLGLDAEPIVLGAAARLGAEPIGEWKPFLMSVTPQAR
jgi:hypothetical protein